MVATEDKRFYQHVGVDPTGMLRAFVKNQTDEDGGQEGASTLTQQYIKNVLIDDGAQQGDEAEQLEALEAARGASGTEGYARKLREAKLAIALEKRMSKEEILEKYLNIAPFGASVYGVESAAQYYFSKPAPGPQLHRGRDDRRRHAEPDQVGPGAQPRGLADAP